MAKWLEPNHLLGIPECHRLISLSWHICLQTILFDFFIFSINILNLSVRSFEDRRGRSSKHVRGSLKFRLVLPSLVNSKEFVHDDSSLIRKRISCTRP